MTTLFTKLKNLISSQPHPDLVTEVPVVLTQAFGLPKKIRNIEKTPFKKLMVELNPNSKELANPFLYLRTFEELILQSTDPLKMLELGDYEKFKSLQRAKTLFDQGDALLQSNQSADAVQHYAQGLLIYPFHSYARLNLAYLYRLLGQLELSEKHYLEGLQHAPDFPALWSNLGRTYLAKKDTKEAEKAFFRALDLFGGNDGFCISELEKLGALIRFYQSAEAPPVFITREQYRDLIKANTLEAKTAESALAYLESSLKEGYHSLFVELWSELKTKYYPNESSWSEYAFLFEGLSARINQNDAQARSIFQAGIQRFPDSSILYTNLGKLQSGPEAQLTIEKAFELGDFRMDNLVLYSQALQTQMTQQEIHEKLLGYFEKYDEFMFVNFVAHERFDRHSIEFASFTAEMIEKIQSPSKRQLEYGLLAGIHAEAGRKKEALLILQKLVNSDTRVIGIHWNYLRCLKELGQMERMNEHLNQLKSLDWPSKQDRIWLRDQLEGLDRESQ